MNSLITLSAENALGEVVSFSQAAYSDAVRRYDLSDIEAVAKRLEAGETLDPEVVGFFDSLALVEAADYPDFDRGRGIYSLALRIELATGQLTHDQACELDLDGAILDYNLGFGKTAVNEYRPIEARPDPRPQTAKPVGLFGKAATMLSGLFPSRKFNI